MGTQIGDDIFDLMERADKLKERVRVLKKIINTNKNTITKTVVTYVENQHSDHTDEVLISESLMPQFIAILTQQHEEDEKLLESWEVAIKKAEEILRKEVGI